MPKKKEKVEVPKNPRDGMVQKPVTESPEDIAWKTKPVPKPEE